MKSSILHNKVIKTIFVIIVRTNNMVVIIKSGANKEIIANRLKALYSTPKKGFDANKFCGILTIEEDPLSIQKRLRDEWE
ncbi:hypothetical protein NBT05_06345 [Aquimarina sp. ERC-38]|uniref:hypothetical protein n=1 Tax=Aquimarina sp. ERC-38 TaxID=2949996 RepID=UPI0022453281|nr:hypothetical protein [Aquimarina sp. ERC-38]UZO82088.1 hypothetical protein NBT05_06345 [Aquimarina sp. ERC-38]